MEGEEEEEEEDEEEEEEEEAKEERKKERKKEKRYELRGRLGVKGTLLLEICFLRQVQLNIKVKTESLRILF